MRTVRRVRSLMLRGRKWRVRWPARLTNDAGKPLFGQCHFRRRTLYIAAGQPERELADTLLHELIHCSFPRARERQVAEAAGDLLRALKRLGLLS